MKTKMNVQTRHNRLREGSALLVVMLISGILLLAATAFMALAANSAFRMRRLTTDTRALHVAEAGVADMIGKMIEDYEHWQSNTNTAVFGDGTFHVVTQTLVNEDSVLITSVGTVEGVSRTTVMELLGNELDYNSKLFRLNGAILSGGDVNFRTAAFTIKGNVHSNQEVTSGSGAHQGDFEPAAGESNVYISAVGDVGDLDGTPLPGAEERELPQFNFDSYRQLAIDGGIYLEGNQNERHWKPVPANGIIYVNGSITISGNSSLIGTLVVNGDIILENNYDQVQFAPGMPSLLSTGNIVLGNRGRIEGIVYAAVNVEVANNVDIDGGIISGGVTEINNKSDINHPSDLPIADPLQPDVPPEVIVGGWLR